MTVKSTMEAVLQTTERNLSFFLSFMISPFITEDKRVNNMSWKSSERQAKMRGISELHRNYRTNF